MTNWCYNRMKITGPISEISRFKQTCIVYENEQARLDFNAIDPMPDFSNNDALPYNDPRHKMGYHWRIKHWGTKWNASDFHVTVDALPYNDAHKAEFDWRVEHWGTKWNAYDFHVTVDAPGCYECAFQAAWGPPVPVWEKMAKMFPALEFSLRG